MDLIKNIESDARSMLNLVMGSLLHNFLAFEKFHSEYSIDMNLMTSMCHYKFSDTVSKALCDENLKNKIIKVVDSIFDDVDV